MNTYNQILDDLKKVGVSIPEDNPVERQLPTIEEIRAYCKEQVDSLWDEVKRFENPHDYYVDLSRDLWQMKYELLEKIQ